MSLSNGCLFVCYLDGEFLVIKASSAMVMRHKLATPSNELTTDLLILRARGFKPIVVCHVCPICLCLRSTKWNASLILLRDDDAELVSLCKVMVWKTHIPVRTQKWPPRLIFAGACHGIVINYVTALLLTMVTASNLVW